MVLAAGAAFGDAPARTSLPGRGILEPVATLSYRTLADQVTAVAEVITAVSGDAARPVTSLVLAQSSWSMPGLWGAQAIGVGHPVNPALADDQLHLLLRTAGTQVLVVPAYGSDPALHVRLARLASGLPDLRAVLTVDAALTPSGQRATRLTAPPATWPVPAIRLEQATCEHLGTELTWADPEDTCVFSDAGGTTGRPRLATHTHGSEVRTAWTIGAGLGLAPGEALLSALPPWHPDALHLAGLGALRQGLHVVLSGLGAFADPAVVDGFWRTIERYRIVAVCAVPAVLSLLSRVPINADISSLRLIYCGAASPPGSEVMRLLEERLLAEHSGTAGRVAVVAHLGDPGPSGTLPAPGTQSAADLLPAPRRGGYRPWATARVGSRPRDRAQ